MKYLKIILLSFFIFNSCKETSKAVSEGVKINSELKNKLENILIKDQGIREIVSGGLTDQRKAELLVEMNISEADIEGDKIYNLIREIDSVNLIEVDSIIRIYGYPSKSIIGEPANEAIYYVIQHSNKIDEYLPLIRTATKNGDIAKSLLAKMEDRNLMYNGLEQIYGTQIRGQAGKDGEWIYYLWPIKNVDSVNILRKNAGFEQTIEEYVEEKGIEFKLYSLNELKDL